MAATTTTVVMRAESALRVPRAERLGPLRAVVLTAAPALRAERAEALVRRDDEVVREADERDADPRLPEAALVFADALFCVRGAAIGVRVPWCDKVSDVCGRANTLLRR